MLRSPFASTNYHQEHVNVVFLGHVDAGKSTLGGSILYATGMVDQRTIDKYKRGMLFHSC
jgi:translation elongation factor EF-1alpha